MNKFKCERCGYCCTLQVKVSPAEIKIIKKLGYKDFLTKDNQIKQKDNRDCFFLIRQKNNTNCKIYAHRPQMCKEYLFKDKLCQDANPLFVRPYRYWWGIK